MHNPAQFISSGVTLTMFTIRRPRLKFLARLQSTKFLLSPKNKKKVATIFSVLLICFLRPLELFGAPEAFWRPLELFVPQILFSHLRTLIWPTYGTFLQPNNFNSKFWRPRRRRGNRGYVTPLSLCLIFINMCCS